jgi:hypothetical protein
VDARENNFGRSTRRPLRKRLRCGPPDREEIALNRYRSRWIAAVSLLLGMTGCADDGPGPRDEILTIGPRELTVRELVSVLAADSLAGRAVGSEGARIAARTIASQFELAGLVPAGDEGYLQRVPLRVMDRPGGRTRVALLGSRSALDSLPESDRVLESNVLALVPGSDTDRAGEAVLLTAHFDHLGIGRPVDGDSIYNGADDDASGVAALVEIARALAIVPARRTVLFAAMAGEERGFLGTRWYVRHPVVPLERTVAALNLEMIGRPDTALGPGALWLTGFERTTMGPALAEAGIAVHPDPRPGHRFYERSDNIALARAGVPAHTLSSFGLHADDHSPDDEGERIDFGHLEAAIAEATRAVRILADGPASAWNPGGRP